MGRKLCLCVSPPWGGVISAPGGCSPALTGAPAEAPQGWARATLSLGRLDGTHLVCLLRHGHERAHPRWAPRRTGPPTSVVRVRPAASGATEREGTPWPGVLVTVPSSSGGPRDRAHPVLPLWGVFPEAASPTQTPAVGVLVPSHLPRGIRKKPASLRRWRGFCGPVLGFGCDVQKKQEETVTPEAVSCPHGALWW